MSKLFLLVAAVSGFLAVALGAFGAHGLKARLSTELMTIYQTAVQYHFYHCLALLAAGLLLLQFPQANSFKISGWSFMLGSLVFSGSLYLLAFTGLRWLGAVTPLGGLLFLIGWATLAIGIYRQLGNH
jgi:uncharacterized membrane protein YgdD (TMEM256/DUF423 family)